MIVNGVASVLPTSGLSTSANESGLWGTPTGQDAKGSAWSTGSNGTRILKLNGQVREAEMWATPTTRDAETAKKAMRGAGSQAKGNERIVPLAVAVTKWPIPTAEDGESKGMGAVRVPSPAARDYRSGRGRVENGHTPQLPEVVGGQLNPDWVELLMGYPKHWTRLGAKAGKTAPRASSPRPRTRSTAASA